MRLEPLVLIIAQLIPEIVSLKKQKPGIIKLSDSPFVNSTIPMALFTFLLYPPAIVGQSEVCHARHLFF